MSAFTETIQSLAQDEPEANIAKIKGAILEQIQSNDSRVTVRLTDHFNHSFVPDIVLQWPGERQDRHLFLRTASVESALRRDIDTLGEKQPIIMPLSDNGGDRLDDGVSANKDSVNNLAWNNNTLVASPASLRAFQTKAEGRPVVSLLSHALLQGGRGLVTEQHAEESSTALAEGFDGAGQGDSGKTTAAVEAVAGLLDSEHAGRINRLLHAVWIGSGAPGSTFPGAAGVTAPLDADSLRFILDLPDVEDTDFWSRLGSGLTLDRICELGSYSPTANLARLLAQTAYRFTGKACRVFRMGEELETPRWSVEANNLVLGVAGDRIYFSPTRLDQLPPAGGQKVSVTVAQLTTRAQRADLRVSEVTLSGTDRTISYTSEAATGVAAGDELSRIQSVMSKARLKSATVPTSTHDISLTFDSRTAVGNGPAKFSLAEFARIVSPILVDPVESTQHEIDEMLSQPSTKQAPVEDSGPAQVAED